MSVRRVAVLLKRELFQGPKSFIFLWSVVLPIVMSLVLSLAFGQGVLFMAVVGGLNDQPVIIILALLLAALLVTGVGFLIASLAKDMMSVLAWGVLALVILVIPGMGVMFPGVITEWAKVIPSYYVVDTVDRVANYGSGWPDIWLNLLILVAFSAAFLLVGMVALRRRFQ